MAEIIRTADINELNLPDGQSTIYATATSKGLKDSPASNTVVYDSNKLTYRTDDSGYYIVTGVLEGFTAVSIPSRYLGMPVVGIDDHAFDSNEDIETVIIPNTVTYIGESAFEGCPNLKSVTIADKDMLTVYFRNSIGWEKPTILSVVGEGFSYQSATNIGVDEDGCDVFRGGAIPFATKIYFYDAAQYSSNPTPDELLTGYTTLFVERYELINYGCYEVYDTGKAGLSIREWDYEPNFDDLLPYSHPLEIGPRAFKSCENLRSINIPNSVRVIGESAFSLSDLYDGLTFSECSALRTISMFAFSQSSISTDVTFPHSLITIGKYAFDTCTSLGNIYIGANVKEIGRSAFDMGAEYGGPKTILISAHSKLEKIGEEAFHNCINAENIGMAGGNGYLVPSTVWYIGKNAFQGCAKLESVGLVSDYGWFVTQGNVSDDRTSEGESTPLSSTALSENAYVAIALKESYCAYNWYKIDVMVAPIISLDGDILTIIDTTGIAETFKIYIDDDIHIASVNASDGALTLTPRN